MVKFALSATRPDRYEESYESERFQISYSSIDRSKIISLAETLDNIYIMYLADYRIEPDPKRRQRLIAYIWDFQTPKVGARASSHGIIDINSTTLENNNLLKPALWHEMYHLLQFSYRLTMPLWMWEGSATLAEIVYARQISNNYKLTSWFITPDVGIPNMNQEGKIPDVYCTMPLFAYLHICLQDQDQGMDQFWHKFSREINTGNVGFAAWDTALKTSGLWSWNKFYTSFLASRFTEAWTTPIPYYPGLKSDKGGPITITPKLSAVTTYAFKNGQPVDQTFSLKANEVKTIRINTDSSQEEFTNYSITIPDAFDNLCWGCSLISHGSDMIVQSPSIYTGNKTFEGHYYPDDRNALLFTFVGPSAGKKIASWHLRAFISDN